MKWEDVVWLVIYSILGGVVVILGIGKFLGPIIIFPGSRSYTLSSIRDSLLLVPRQTSLQHSGKHTRKKADYIPTRVILNQPRSRDSEHLVANAASKAPAYKIVLYFHGNGEDIGQVGYVLEEVCEKWQAHAVAVEYPGYGIYPASKSGYSRDLFVTDAMRVYDYVKEKLGCQDSQMIIVGRSIGSGIATELASRRSAGALFLVSPYTSIHNILSDKLPSFLFAVVAILKCAVVNYFDNLSLIGRIRMPTFFLHGQRDQVISFQHSKKLIKAKVQGESMLIDPPRMTHNDYINWESDLGTEGMRFMERQKVGANASAVDLQGLLNDRMNLAALEAF